MLLDGSVSPVYGQAADDDERNDADRDRGQKGPNAGSDNVANKGRQAMVLFEAA
jgi:hypothetical protein